MSKIILCAAVAVFGVVYALFPKWFLSKKSPDGKVTELAVKTAWISGIVVAVLGAAVAVWLLSRL